MAILTNVKMSSCVIQSEYPEERMGRSNWNGNSSMFSGSPISVKSDHGTTPQGFCSQIELREKKILLNSFLSKQKKNPFSLRSFQS